MFADSTGKGCKSVRLSVSVSLAYKHINVLCFSGMKRRQMLSRQGKSERRFAFMPRRGGGGKRAS